jgi:HK97 family phage portal protein
MDNFFRFFGKREVTTTDPNAPENQPAKGADWAANTTVPSGRSSLCVPTWHRCVALIMQTMGQMVIQYQKVNTDGGNYIEDRWGLGKSLNYLLQIRPNPMMTASQMMEQIEFRKIYHGNAYVYIDRGQYGDPVALWLCTSGSYNPISDTYTLTYNCPKGTVSLSNADPSDVLHFKSPFLGDGMYHGIPIIDFAMKTLTISATGDEQSLQNIAKGGKYKVLIQEDKAPNFGTKGRANPQQMKSLTQRFAEDWQSNDVVLLDNVADAKIISQTAQQLQLLEQRGYGDEAICRLLGVPKVMAMIGEGGSYKMPEHATQEFMLRTIQPRIRETEDEFNSKLLSFDDFGKRRIHVCELALRRLDAKGQADIDKLHLEAGWSVNELRAQYDLPSIPEGDAHYVSTNLAEVGSEKLRSNGGGRPAEKPAEE